MRETRGLWFLKDLAFVISKVIRADWYWKNRFFLPKCHEVNDGLKLRCSLLDCKFGGYLLCVTFCLNKQLCMMDFDRIREDILKGKNYLHFTADWLMVCLSVLNSGSASFVSSTSHLAGNENNNVNFQPKWFGQGTLGRAFSGKSKPPHQACLAEVKSVPRSAPSAVPPWKGALRNVTFEGNIDAVFLTKKVRWCIYCHF